MKRFIIYLAMLVLFAATPCMAVDIEVTDVIIKWGSDRYGSTSYKACVVVTNHSDVRYQVYVKLTWYDSYGYKVHYRTLGDPVRPHSIRILCVYGGLDNHDVEVFHHLEGVIDSMWELK